jgi:hypothetical protein
VAINWPREGRIAGFGSWRSRRERGDRLGLSSVKPVGVFYEGISPSTAAIPSARATRIIGAANPPCSLRRPAQVKRTTAVNSMARTARIDKLASSNGVDAPVIPR